jgi:hypothetical protein
MGKFIKGVQPASRVNPRTMVIYSKPKVGKTEAYTHLDNHIIIDMDDSKDYYTGNFVEINNIIDYKDFLKEVIEDDVHFTYGIIDTVTSLIPKLANQLAVNAYNKDSGLSGDAKKPLNWDITTLDYGKGYIYIREAVMKVVNRLATFCDNVIISAHVADKAVSVDGSDLTTKEIDLPGKLKNILALKVDALGLVYRDASDPNLNKISFIHDDSVVGGSRSKHLRSKIFDFSKLDPDTGKLTTYWDNIYI